MTNSMKCTQCGKFISLEQYTNTLFHTCEDCACRLEDNHD